VTRNSDGTVTVKLVKVSGIAGANRSLASMGVRAKLVAAMVQTRAVAQLQPCGGRPAALAKSVTIAPASIPHPKVLLLQVANAAPSGSYALTAKLRAAGRASRATYHAAAVAGYGPGHAKASLPRVALARDRALVKRAQKLAALPPGTTAKLPAPLATA